MITMSAKLGLIKSPQFSCVGPLCNWSSLTRDDISLTDFRPDPDNFDQSNGPEMQILDLQQEPRVGYNQELHQDLSRPFSPVVSVSQWSLSNIYKSDKN